MSIPEIPDNSELAEARKENDRLRKTLAKLSGLAEGGEVAAPIIGDEVGKQLVNRFARRRAEEIERDSERKDLPRPVIRNGTWLSAQQFGPVTWAVPGLLPEGVGLLAGKPKAGKSWLSLSLGLSLAAGAGPLGLLRQSPRPVLHLALEDSDRRMKDRCGLLGWHQVPELFEYVTEAHPAALLDTVWEWLDRWPGQRPVIVIDTWGKVCPPARKGETTYDRDYRVGGYIKSLAAKADGSTVLVVHHTRKQGAEDFIDTVSGTEGIAGAADTVMILGRTRGEDSATLQVTGRDVEEGSYRLLGFPLWQLDGGTLASAASASRAETDRGHMGDRGREILDRIEQQGQITTGEAAAMLGISSDQASAYLSRMSKAGKIAKSGRGVYVSTVGSVGSVGIPNTPNEPNRGYTREGWAALYRMADFTDREAAG